MRRYILIIMAALLGTAAFAQTITVSGTVKEDSNEPAIGASVIVSGTTNGVVTDINGRYTIKAKKGQVLVFNYLGFKEEKVMLTGQTIVDIKLKPDVNLLDELVVVGYGATKRSDLTGSVASISSDKVSHFQSASVLDALSGQIAGVSIVSTDGTPGAGFDIKIRGVGSINGDASPLYVVDGFQVDNIDYLANSDIESIEFLKDASSSAIYGSRAANGVVLVSTKSGKNGKVNLGRQQPEKPLVNRIDELKKKDPNFSEAKFLDDAANLYVRMQNCWTAKDLEPVRPHLTTELYAKSDRQIQAYKNNHQTDHVERISVLDTRIVGCDADNVNDIITVQLTARIVDYVTNDDTGAIIRGSNSKELFMTYQWTFIRSLGKTTGESGDIDSEHCPNCGAPIDLNQSAVCPYCGATVTSGDYDWVVSNIRGISQRSN